MNINNRDKNLRVLAYHGISDRKKFEEQMVFLAKAYNIISLEDLKNFFSKGSTLPDKALLITFDDGDVSVYENAFPVLKKYKIPAIVFIITSLIGTQEPFWWNEIKYYLGEKKGNVKSWEAKQWSNKIREEYLLNLKRDNVKEPLKYTQLNSTQILEMHRNKVVISNHSHTHPMFDKCTGEEIARELEASTNYLKKMDFDTEAFAYPNGNFSAKAETYLYKNDFKIAFLFDHKINQGSVDPLRVSRLIVNDTTPFWKLKLILSGWHTRILPLTKKLGKILK